MNVYVRNARYSDISRLAEILVFGKRCAYRELFCDDYGSFAVLNVAGEIKRMQNHPSSLNEMLVYDDGIVKGLLRYSVCGKQAELCELYVEPCFIGSGIGSALLSAMTEKVNCAERIILWVLAGNESGRAFYEKHGFAAVGDSRLSEGSEIVELKYDKLLNPS